MLLGYFLNDFEMVQVALTIIVIAFVFTFHLFCICTTKSYILESSRLLSYDVSVS